MELAELAAKFRNYYQVSGLSMTRFVRELGRHLQEELAASAGAAAGGPDNTNSADKGSTDPRSIVTRAFALATLFP